MYLLVGLGNPGDKYRETRHNIGFLFLDHLADRLGLSITDSKWQALYSKGVLWGETVLLAKPQTYMNASGRAVAAMANFFKIPARNIIVVHDDLDLPVGRLKIVINRGAGGHNGIKSVIEALGTKEFCRIRAGIGRPEPPISVSHYVLSPFTPQEEQALGEELQAMEYATRLIIEEGITAAMTQLNRNSISD